VNDGQKLNRGQQCLNSVAELLIKLCCDITIIGPEQSPAYQRKPKSVKMTERWNLNPKTGLMIDIGQAKDRALCDKGCGWSGYRTEPLMTNSENRFEIK